MLVGYRISSDLELKFLSHWLRSKQLKPSFSLKLEHFDLDLTGTVKFVGVIDDNAIAPNLYVGVKLDDNGELTCNSSKMMEFKYEKC